MTTDPERARELMRACHERRLEREGIPMVLALVDERPGRSLEIAEDAAARGEGERYAELLADYTRILTPPPIFEEGDETGLVTAMQVLAYEHFGPGATS